MKKQLVTYTVIGCLLVGTTSVSAAPPGRPLPVTASQFAALRQLEQQPEHQQVLNTRATFQSEHEKTVEFNRQSDDFWTGAMYAGYPGFILALLICGAPL